jgi:titin
VTWSAGAGTNAADIDAQIITATPSAGAAVVYDLSKSITSATLTGLTNAVEYTVTIKTINRKIDGTAILFESSTVTLGTATPLAVPVLPTGFAVDASDARVIVRWNRADTNIVTGYNIRWSVSGNTSAYSYLNFNELSTPQLSVDISGLTNNQAYDFSIQSYNTNRPPNNVSLYLTPLVTATPRGRPVAPIASSLIAGVGQATLTWTDGVGAITADIDNYVVSVSPADVSPITVGSAAAKTLDISGLTNGVEYAVSIYAANNVFQSGVTAAGSVTPLAVPSAVDGMVVDPSNASILVNWTAALEAAATSVSGYTIRYITGTPATSATIDISDRTTTSATISGVTNGATYSVDMRAVNAVTVGPYNTAVGNIVPRDYPSAPTSASAIGGDGYIDVSWVYTGSLTNIDNYAIIYNGGSAVEVSGIANSARTYRLTGLTNGVSYTIGVYAYNNNSRTGAKLFSSAVTSGGSATPLGPPATPELTGTATEGQITLNWTMSSTAALAGFVVKQDGVELGLSLGAGARSATISGLTNGVSYTYTVLAYNTNGTRSAESTVVTLTPRAIPNPVRNLSGLADISEAVIDWITDTDVEHPAGDIDMFRVELTDTSANLLQETIDFSGSQFSIDISKVKLIDISYNADPGTLFSKLVQVNRLVNGTPYSLSVKVRNKNGDFSPASTVAVKPLAAPPMPGNISLRAGDKTISVSWTLPASYGADNLAPINPAITSTQVLSG